MSDNQPTEIPDKVQEVIHHFNSLVTGPESLRHVIDAMFHYLICTTVFMQGDKQDFLDSVSLGWDKAVGGIDDFKRNFKRQE